MRKVLMSRHTGLGPALTPAILLNFLNSEGNIFLTLSSSTPTPSSISSLLLELDIQLPAERTSLVVDHFNYDTVSSTDKHDVLLLPRPGPLRPDVVPLFSGSPDSPEKIIAFPRGVAQTLGPNSALLSPLLRAPETAYTYNPKEESEQDDDSFPTGTQLSLITALQARNNARFLVLGSVELLANEWFDAKVKLPTPGAKREKTANRDFAQTLSAWAFQELGVLKVGKIEHHLAQTPDAKSSASNLTASAIDKNPKIYRVKNDVVRFPISVLNYPLNVSTRVTLRGPSGGHCVELLFFPHHSLTLTPPRHSPSNSPSTPSPTSPPTTHPAPTPSNSNSQCSPPSSA